MAASNFRCSAVWEEPPFLDAAIQLGSVVQRSVSKPIGQVQTRCRVSPMDSRRMPYRHNESPMADAE